jgi:type I restriction enzyme, S subunit
VNRRDVQLGDGIHVKHGFAFKGEYFANTGEHMVLTPGNFLEKGGFRTREGKERYYHSDFPEEYLLKEGDLIVAMTEQGEGLLGSAARIPGEGKYLHNQRLGLVQIVDSELFERRYLYWVFNSANVRAQIRATSTGAKVKHTAPERIKKVRISIPDIEGQKAIAHILDSYENFIATNQRRIALLEEAARRLYREWFVHLRFPGHEAVKTEDGIPEGWESKTLNDVCEAIGGGTPSTSRPEFWGGEVVWVTPTDVTRNGCLALLDSEKKITEAGFNGNGTYFSFLASSDARKWLKAKGGG